MIHPESLEVHVEIDGTLLLAGRAWFQRNRRGLSATTFQYERGYLAHPRAYALDPALELVSGSLHVAGLPGAFSDTAPDRWGRNLIGRRERARAREESRPVPTLDDVDYLAGVSDVTRQGALRFRVDDRSEFLHPGEHIPRLIRLPQLLRAADTVARHPGEDDFEAVKSLLEAGTGSLGGARPKAAVIGDDGRQLIAKFPHPEDGWDVMAWEATSLDLANAAGITTPPHRLTIVGDRTVLLLDRFDRGGDGGRIGYMSAMTLLEKRDGDSSDYVEIAERFAEVSERPKDDARELFRRVVLSVGLNNTDDHLRNHGFVRGKSGWSLSPVFDVNPNPEPGVRQTTIAGADRPDLEPAGIRELAQACLLPPSEAVRELDRSIAALEEWRSVARRNGIGSSELSCFEPVFPRGVDTLRAARALIAPCPR